MSHAGTINRFSQRVSEGGDIASALQFDHAAKADHTLKARPMENVNSYASNQDLNGTTGNHLPKIAGEVVDTNASLELYIMDFQLQCATEKSDFLYLNSVKPVLSGSTVEVLLLEKDSPETRKQASPVQLMDVDSLKIVATSEELPEFAFTTLTKDELTAGLERRTTKSFTTDANVPTLELSVISASIPQEDQIKDGCDEELDLAGTLFNHGIDLIEDFERTGSLPDIFDTISIHRQAIQLTPDDRPARPFQHCFKRTDDVSNLMEETSNKQQEIPLTPNGHPHMKTKSNNLGGSFLQRFTRTGNASDLTDAISIQQVAVQKLVSRLKYRVTPATGVSALKLKFLVNGISREEHRQDGDRLRAIAEELRNLTFDRKNSFESMGNLPKILEDISVLQQGVQITPNGHADMPNKLGKLFLHRFERRDEVADIMEAILLQRRAVQLTPDGHPDMPNLLNSLGNSLLHRFERAGNISDISEAISVQQQAAQLTRNGHPDKPTWLKNLGKSFLRRFGHTGHLSDILEAISIQQNAIQLTPNDHADMPELLSNLGSSFRRRFERTGDISDISEAITVQQQAVQLTPYGHHGLPAWLNNLGISLMGRFERTCDVSDISEAISVQQKAAQLIPDGDSDMPTLLNNLGISFLRRFEHRRDVSDISEAILVQQKAVQLTPNDHASMPAWLNNLGNSLLRRFQCTGDGPDISDAISAHRRAAQLTPNGHADMPGRLNNLGISLLRSFERTGNDSDDSEAISVQQRAVDLTPHDHPQMPAQLNSLGNSFMAHFKCTSDVSDISEAISAYERAIQLTPNGHADMPTWLNNLANSFLHRFKCTGNVQDLFTTTLTFQKSATTFGPPFPLLHAARYWAQISKLLSLPQTLTAYNVALDLIAQIAGLDRTIQQRHTHLIEISSLTTDAASAALTLGDVEKALQWLEQGRCLVWNQLNQLRTPLDHLRAHDEHLAERFSNISGALEVSGSRHGSEDTDASSSQKMSLQDQAHFHIKLSREWSQLLDEIRCIPQFQDFLRPPRTSNLLKRLPSEGTIILVNVHKDRCDALALISSVGAPVHIPLDFTYDEASNLREHLRQFLSCRRVRMREEDRGTRTVLEEGTEMRSEIHLVLEALWLRVVKPILDALEHCSPVMSDPLRIWWCPTGPLAFLPLHAAGIYSVNGRSPPGDCISDFAISSYTPTVGSLLEKLNESANVKQPASSKLLIISQPKTPGRSAIPATTKEMNCISDIIGSYNGESLRLEGESGSVSRVKVEMESHGSIHLACHATQDLENPLKSGFYLHDGRLELADIMKQKFAVRELAFLSACQTSTGAEKLSEEAVHLAAGMLAAGYQSVVATMWSIKDRYGPVVAESFYRDLMERGKASGNPGLDSSGAAHALHHAIQGIRETLGDTEQGLLTWVPYVHFGY